MEPATKLVVIVGIHFMILFTAFNAFQTILVKIYEDQGDYIIGPYIFALTYFIFMISNLFVSRLRFSQKWQITFATLTYALNYMTGFVVIGTPVYVKYIIVSLGAILNGIGGSVIWTSTSTYIHKVCHYYHKQNQKGHYFGLFNTIFCFSCVLGAIVVTFGLSQFQTYVYFILVSSIALFAFFYGLFFIKHIKIKQDQVSETHNDVGFFKSAIASAKSTLSYYSIMRYSLGLIMFDGINLGVVTSTMLHLMPVVDDQHQNRINAGICLILYGVGCLLGGYLGGKLCDNLQIRLSSTILMYLYAITILFSIIASYIMKMWCARVACFFWGFVLFYLTANLMVICSRLYKGTSESFAVTKQFHALIFVIYQIISMATQNSIKTQYIMIVILVLLIPTVWGVCRSPRQKDLQDRLNKQSLNTQSQEQL